jgi:uncharacterized protein
MSLLRQDPNGTLFVRRCEAARVVLGDRELTRSFLLAVDRVVEDWPVPAIEALDAASVDAVLALLPEVVLLGTGSRQRFPAAAILARFLARGVGVEVMDNAAAARTFNVLAAEGRRAVAAFMLPLPD